MEQLIDLLLKFIVSNKTICKDIKETISEISSEDISEDNLLAYYNTIPSEEMSLIYACLAKILNLKEYLLYKEIETIAKSWDEITVGSKPFHVPYVINNKDFETKIAKYKTNDDFKDELIELLKSICKRLKAKVEVQKTDSKFDSIDKLLGGISAKKSSKLSSYIVMVERKGKTNWEIVEKTADEIYKEWNKSEKTIPFLDLFSFTYEEEKTEIDKITKEKKVTIETKTSKSIDNFFRIFKLGVDCSGYVNQVYVQWMLDHGKDKIEMIDTIGPNHDEENYKYTEGHKCRDGCGAIREKKYLGVDYSLWHVGYFIPIKEIKDKQPKFINIWKRTEAIEAKKDKNGKNVKNKNGEDIPDDIKYDNTDETIDLITVNEIVKSNLKAGDMMCFQYQNPQKRSGAHFVIVEKTGIDQKGQWYFCITESTEADKKSWIYSKGKREKNTKEWDGVRHDQGYYTSIEEFVELRKSSYDFFWFCRPKAIAEYYDSNTIIEYKKDENES